MSVLELQQLLIDRYPALATSTGAAWESEMVVSFLERVLALATLHKTTSKLVARGQLGFPGVALSYLLRMCCNNTQATALFHTGIGI